MRRREFMFLAGAAAALPLAARPQQRNALRRVGMLIYGHETDPEIIERFSAFRKGLQELGWAVGARLRIDVRFVTNGDDVAQQAKELVELEPETLFWRTRLRAY